MTKKEFFIRFTLWTLIVLVLPITYIFATTTIFQIVNKISAWAIVIVVILALFFRKILKYLNQGAPFSIFTQIINGLVKTIIPLIALLAITIIIRTKADEVLQFAWKLEKLLYVIIFCQLMGILVNPFPKWLETNKDNNFVNKLNMFFDKMKDNKKE